jgi:hypothetical protein
MSSNPSNIEERVMYGLETIDPERKIEVPLKDLLYAYQVIAQLIYFFHQPLHYQTIEDVKKFLGEGERGAYDLLSEICYERFYDIWPEDIKRGFYQGRFDKTQADMLNLRRDL